MTIAAGMAAMAYKAISPVRLRGTAVAVAEERMWEKELADKEGRVAAVQHPT